ncbi:hypothetical protein [Polaromonas sp.]|uniref:hypothetical protein n=1 Tax=Polaromonas sp. TaxID=1869339 RepID=UPI00352AC66F
MSNDQLGSDLSTPGAEALAAKEPWWWSYGHQNPVALLTALMLTCGGVLLLGFFLRIGFMPDVDAAGSTALVFAVSFVGLGTVIGSMVVSVLPGMAIRYLFDDAGLPVRPFSLAAAVLPAILLIVWVLASVFAPGVRAAVTDATAYGVLIVVAVLSGVLSAWKSQGAERFCSAWLLQYASKTWAVTSGATLWAGSMLIALWFALSLGSDSDHAPWTTVLLITVWLILITAANVGTALLPLRRAWRASVMFCLLGFAVLVFMTGSFSTVSATTVKLLGLGEIQDVDIVVKAEVCQALRLTASSPLRCSLAAETGGGILRNVVLRSRIGGQVVIEMASSDRVPGSAVAARVVLRRDDVLLWSVRVPTPRH